MYQYIKKTLIVIPLIFLGSCFRQSVDQKKAPNAVSYDIQEALKQENVVPVVIIGSGPAGLSAALYMARAGMKAFVFAGPMPCGQLTQTTYIENWPGRERVLGLELMDDIKKQTVSFGATIIHDSVRELDINQWPFTIKTEDGRSFKALSVILATGATPRTLNIPGERDYWGKGVTTCAVCDAGFFTDKNVVIAGGGDSAIEMVFELTPHVKHVTVLVRKGSLRAAQAMQKKMEAYSNVTIEYYKEITQIYGNGQKVEAIDVYDNQTKTTQKRPIDGVFLAIGHDPNNAMLPKGIQLDEHGYVVMQGRTQETSIPGIFAAGEIQDPFYRQAIVASGEGVKAALDAASFLYGQGFSVDVGARLEQNFYDHFADPKKEILEITTIPELYEHVIKKKGVVVLDVYSMTCPCCIQMLPHLEVVAHKLDGQVNIVKMNYPLINKTIRVELSHKFDVHIRRLPTLIVFKDGVFQDINTRVMNKIEIYDYLSSFISKK